MRVRRQGHAVALRKPARRRDIPGNARELGRLGLNWKRLAPELNPLRNGAHHDGGSMRAGASLRWPGAAKSAAPARTPELEQHQEGAASGLLPFEKQDFSLLNKHRARRALSSSHLIIIKHEQGSLCADAKSPRLDFIGRKSSRILEVIGLPATGDVLPC